MKRIAIISNIPITADNHKATLESLFKHVSIKVVTISEWHGGRIEADVALVTALDLVPYAQKYLNPECTIVQSTYTLEKFQLRTIQELERSGPIVVAHESPRAALHPAPEAGNSRRTDAGMVSGPGGAGPFRTHCAFWRHESSPWIYGESSHQRAHAQRDHRV